MMIKRRVQLHVSHQSKLQETKQNALSIPPLPSLSSGCLPPPPFLSLSFAFHHMKRKGKPSWPFPQPCHPLYFHPPISAPTFSNYSFAHQVQRENLEQHLAPTHTHTRAHGVPPHPRLFHAHTLLFSVPYTSNT